MIMIAQKMRKKIGFITKPAEEGDKKTPEKREVSTISRGSRKGDLPAID
jgi:hypothetical protein